MRSFALFLPIADEAQGDAVLSEIYGTPQSGSFLRALSATGEPPFTHLGAYAAGLSETQAAMLEAQTVLSYREASWAEALSDIGLVPQQ